MAKQDKITELFRANAHKLAQRPSDASWARLERRLQQQRPITERRSQRRPEGQRVRLQSLSIAAGLALLLGLSAVFLWMLNEQDRQYQRALAVAERALQVEELPLEAEALPSPIARKRLERAYHEPQKVIEEGRPEQKLVARVSPKATSVTPAVPATPDSASSNHQIGR